MPRVQNDTVSEHGLRLVALAALVCGPARGQLSIFCIMAGVQMMPDMTSGLDLLQPQSDWDLAYALHRDAGLLAVSPGGIRLCSNARRPFTRRCDGHRGFLDRAPAMVCGRAFLSSTKELFLVSASKGETLSLVEPLQLLPL